MDVLRFTERATRPVWIVTANPEIMLYAKRHPWYWDVLRRADLRIVDGFGLQMVGRMSGAGPKRIAGAELAERVLTMASERGWRVALLGGKTENAERALWNIRQRHPTLRIRHIPLGDVTPHGQEIPDPTDATGERRYPEVLLVALGHPKQEAWIATHVEKMPETKIVMGIGGTVDFWSGAIRRAPKWVQNMGMEWAWRLTQEPKRWRRILNAVILFPVSVLADRGRK